MIYKSPIVENKSTAEFFAKIFNPCGPIITPEIISPIIPGILIFLSKIGESRIIKSINEKINTGLLKGNSNSCNRCLKNSIIW
ncbi:hypothetical protein D3C72_622610 [compost metagenome]